MKNLIPMFWNKSEIKCFFSMFLIECQEEFIQSTTRGTPWKYVTGMCGHIDPHFQTACHWMTPFLFFTFCSHLMTPIFKMLSHLMTPFFRNIYKWKWASCSHWMMPIFTNKWPPRNMYPIFVWKEGFMWLLNRILH